MIDLFGKVLELSWQAGVIALAVMVIRFLLRNQVSRRALCLLWALVALRLLLPVSLTVESPTSLQAKEAPVSRIYQEMQETPAVPSAPSPVELRHAAVMSHRNTLAKALPWIWLMGMAGMVGYMLFSFLLVRQTLQDASHIDKNVYRCNRWNTPFVLGIFAPRIYIPETVSEEDLPQMLTHEWCHIRRWDHVLKPFAFLLLSVNWFNPLLWLAYLLLGRDMENACDELALQNADAAQRAAYSRALVACASRPKMAAVSPLAFGEVAVKERVKNVLRDKKQALWAIVLLIIAAVVIIICLLTKPANKPTFPAELPSEPEILYAAQPDDFYTLMASLGITDQASAAGYGCGAVLTTEQGIEGVDIFLYPTKQNAFSDGIDVDFAAYMRGACYILLTTTDRFHWVRFSTVNEENAAICWGRAYEDMGYEITKARTDETVRQEVISAINRDVKAGQVPESFLLTSDGIEVPSSMPIKLWTNIGPNDPLSVRAEDYGIIYDIQFLPNWDTVPLSYLCAYYLNADGAFAQGAMDTLATRYQQNTDLVLGYIRSLAGQPDPQGRGDAAEVLLQDLTLSMESME